LKSDGGYTGVSLLVHLGNVAFKKIFGSLALVVHACNPSYSGGRNQEDGGSKPAQENSLRDLISKISNTK
jgi:hypothetical protein